jgi:hypothetical protein
VTSQRAAFALGILCGGLAFAAGCGDDAATTELTLVAPAANSTLTPADDRDPDRPGLQFEIVGASKGLREGTSVDLYIDRAKESRGAKIEEDGALHVPAVTLPPGTHRIYLQTSTGSTSTDPKQAFTVRTLLISVPENGAVLTSANDENEKQAGVQLGVSIDGYALASDEDVTLMLDGEAVGSEPLDIMGQAVGQALFRDVTLGLGKHTLLAYAGEGKQRIESEETKVEVEEDCAAVSFISPIAPDSGNKLTLGGDECPDKTIEPFTTRVAISTDAPDGRPARLFINDHLVTSTLISDGHATFDDVALTHKHEAANTLAVTVENAEGITCRRSFPADVFVDCTGASCSIASPIPAPYVAEAGALTQFLNRALLSDGSAGFDVRVESDKDAAGQPIQLVVDGAKSDALDAKAEESGDVSSAAFPALTLPEGRHTIEALCTDAHGNITSSSEFSWVVDVTACAVEITDPSKNASFVPADDSNSKLAGVQVLVSAEIEGDDCSSQRVAVCTPKAGIKGAKSRSYDGKSPLMSVITLANESDQNLCVEVEDRAGNVGRDDVAVTFRNDAPKLNIETPSDGDKINARGGSGFIKDADRSSATTCDAEFTVACSELGTKVQLYRADQDGDPDGDAIGSADCKKPKASDDELPAGYGGRAVLTVPIGAGDVRLVATQTLTGQTSGRLTGTSSALTLHADCKPPQASFSNDPCASDDGNELTLAQAASRDVRVKDASDDLVSATLSFVNDDGTTGMPDADSISRGAAKFDDLDLGSGGDSSSDVTITVTLRDDFKNSTELSCTATIFDDTPALESYTSPQSDGVFGVAGLAGCDTGVSGVFGVRVVAKADKQADRSLSVLVNGAPAEVDEALGTEGAIDVCVPVPDDSANSPDGPSTLTLRVESTIGGGAVEQSRTISVHQLALTNVMANDVFGAADNCASSGFGYQVMIGVDPSLAGTAYTLGNGTEEITGSVSGATISACLPLAEGANTITVGIDGTNISYQADVTVSFVPD